MMNSVVEIFRGLAALMVLLHHYTYATDATLTAGAFHFFHSGVDLFFVITGLLFSPYLLGLEKIAPAAFLIRRLFRIYPLYLVSLCVTALLAYGHKENIAGELLIHLFFLQNWPDFGLPTAGFFSLVYWTLPVEIAYYGLIFAAIGYFRLRQSGPADRSAHQRRLAGWGVSSLLLFALTYTLGGVWQSECWVLWQTQLTALLPAFWFGMLVHYFRPTLAASGGRSGMVLALGVAGLLMLYLAYPATAQGVLTPRPFGWFNLCCALSYALVLAGSLSGMDWLMAGHTLAAKKRLVECRPYRGLVFLGGISYGVYLFHEPILFFLQNSLPALSGLAVALLSLAVTLLVAWGLNILVEEPGRNYGRKLSGRFRDK